MGWGRRRRKLRVGLASLVHNYQGFDLSCCDPGRRGVFVQNTMEAALSLPRRIVKQ